MNIEASNTRNTPTYLLHYDMQRPPFASHHENDMYYSDALLTQRLDLLLHLTQYGHELLLVTAEEGGGKTSILNQFIQRAHSYWRIGHITSSSTCNKEQLIKQIYRQFLLQDDLHKKALSAKELKNHVEAYLMTNHRAVLLVDDAHTLPIDALELLLDLSTIININKSSLQIILFCHPQIKVKLATPELEQKRFLKQRKIDLPKLTITQTDKLIQHRVELTGLRGSKIFPLSTVERIFKTSNGNPNQICEIAHQILTDSTPKERHSFFNLNYLLHPPLPRLTNSIAISAIVILLVGILYFQDTINAIYQDESKQESQMPNNQQIQMALEIPPQKSTVEKTQTMLDEAEPLIDHPPENPENNQGETDSLTAISVPSRKALQTPPSSPEKQAVAQNSGRITTLEKLPRSSNDNSVMPLEQTRAKPILSIGKVPISVKRQTKWILSQKSDHYTLQLLAGYNLSTIKNFLAKYTLDRDNLAYYRSYNNGKEWHSLVYGIFPDRDSAKLAINKLPAAVVVAKPWIRKLHYIKRDINDTL